MRTIFAILSWMLLLEPAPSAELPQTVPLQMEGDLSAQMVEGISQFLDRALAATPAAREKIWRADDAGFEAKREFLRERIGATDKRVAVGELKFVSSTLRPAKITETTLYEVYAVQWAVFDDYSAEGLWLKPLKPAKARLIVLADADQTPEMLTGLVSGVAESAQLARKIAEQGIEVFVPALVNRDDRFSGNPELNRFTNQPHREWIYRQAYQMGRHLIGYEVQAIMSLLDWCTKESPDVSIAIAGYGEGGLLALYAAALDPRFKGALVSGYFSKREQVWQEPIYRNVFGLLNELADAELAALTAPRGLIIEFSETPQVKGPPSPRQGRTGAAPGIIATPERYDVEEEFQRAQKLAGKFAGNLHFLYGNEGRTVGPGSDAALKKLCEFVGVKFESKEAAPPKILAELEPNEARQQRLVAQLTAHTQELLRRSERYRDQHFWAKVGKVTADQWKENSAPWKKQLWEEVIGKWTNQYKPLNPRSRQIYDAEKFAGYDVVLDVFDGVFAWGVLLVPKDLKPGEKRPVVVTQHGLEGLPRDTIEPEGKTDGYHAYKAFAARLAERGFIVFSPHNPYRGRDQFRVLQRKANPLGKSLFSFILAQHEQILTWLSSLPNVDAERIGFYGLSYGGKTAMRVPSLLEGYCLSICSADFNEWITKNATVDSPYSYMFTIEYEMPEFNLGHTFNYAEMAALVAPRPFMVERGHDDGVAPDEWVAHEYARVRRFYVRLGIPERTEIEFFNGPHTINGVGTFEFLHKHLRWPGPSKL